MTEKRFRVLTGELHHETNTFSVLPTTINNFHAEFYWSTPSDIKRERYGTKTVYGATFEAAEKFNWDLKTTISASANPSGLVTDDTFEFLVPQLLKGAGSEHYDGVLLHLHGAMVSHKYEDCEGEILRRLRALIGPEIPIVVTLDLHGNITQAMVDNSTLLLAVRTYPHIDFYETAQHGAELLQQIMLQEIQPVTVLARRAMLKGLDGGKTQDGTPLKALIDKYNVMEKAGDCLVVSICAGFLASDIYDIGPSATVTVDIKKHSNLDSAKITAQRIAEEAMDYIWETRHFAIDPPYSINEALRIAEEYHYSKNNINIKPLVIAEITDNPGSGHYGDATNLLKAAVLHNQKALNSNQPANQLTDVIFYAIFDPAAVIEGENLGVGNMGYIEMGGRWDPRCGGGPLRLYGKVVSLTDGCFQTFGPMGFGGMWQNYGKSMLFRIDHLHNDTEENRCDAKGAVNQPPSILRSNLEVIVITNNGQIYDTAQITSMGCDLQRKKTVIVKSKHHFRACLTPLAGKIICADGGGLGSTILVPSPTLYSKVRRPIWPLDYVD